MFLTGFFKIIYFKFSMVGLKIFNKVSKDFPHQIIIRKISFFEVFFSP